MIYRQKFRMPIKWHSELFLYTIHFNYAQKMSLGIMECQRKSKRGLTDDGIRHYNEIT